MRQMTADFYFHVGNTSCWTCFSISQRARISVSPRTDAETSSAWRDDNKHEKRKRRDVCVQCPRFSLTQIAPIPPKAYSYISWDSREIITATRCMSKDNTLRERMQCGDFIWAPHWLFRADILHGPMQIYCNGCRRYLKRATQYYCQFRQRLRTNSWDSRDSREVITPCALFGRCTQRPYPLIALLRQICIRYFWV